MDGRIPWAGSWNTMLLLAVVTAPFSAFAAVPPSTTTWAPLQSSPVKIECADYQGKPYCRSTGVIGAPVDVAAKTFEQLDLHVDKMGSIASVTRLESDVLHVVMDYPFPLDDRDYVARFVHTVDGTGTHVFAWTPITHASAPAADGIVRLSWLDGEWRFAPEGANTRVTYVWEADPGGSLPDVGTVRKKAGTFAVSDMANACGTKILSP